MVRAITETVAILSIALVGFILISISRTQVQAEAQPPVYVTHVLNR